MIEFQKNLKELRKTYGFTQRQLAQKLGISQPSYIRYEIGTSEPSLETLCKIADVFDVSVDFLLGRADI
ncbi:MAG: helix-turn-helix transcriptional regulator [Clostridiales bacterium]|nr:helix-turn-helix transcriptional regulator [Clostridiales bacterium]